MLRTPQDPPLVPKVSLTSFVGDSDAQLARKWPRPFRGANEKVLINLQKRAEKLATPLERLARELFDDPEIGLEEARSASRVCELLHNQGYSPTLGVFGLPTAIECSVGVSGGPTIAILAEYDALPDIGHGCGHNLICAAGVGAFLTLAPEVDRIGGRLVLLGTPAEENASGKEIMAQAGALEGVAAAIMVHPFTGPSRTSMTYLGLREVEVTFRGRTAHASASPYHGVNALDAAVQTYQAVSMFRQQMVPGDRVHAIISDGGQAPNVIPGHAGLHFYLRSATMAGLSELSARLQSIFEGAALATGCQVTAKWDGYPPALPMRSNEVLERVFAHHFMTAGEPILGPDPTDTSGQGSTDMGNVSQRIPAAHPMIGIAPAGISLHTVEFAQFACTPTANKVMLAAVKALAGTAADFLADPAMRQACQTAFEQDPNLVTDLVAALAVAKR